MNWQTIKTMQRLGDVLMLIIMSIIILSYPIEWLIRYMRVR